MKRTRDEMEDLVRIYDASTQQAEEANKRAKQARKDLIKRLRESLQQKYNERLHSEDSEGQFKDYIEEIEKFHVWSHAREKLHPWGSGGEVTKKFSVFFPDWTFEYTKCRNQVKIYASKSETKFFLSYGKKEFTFQSENPNDTIIARDLNKRVNFFRWLDGLDLKSEFVTESRYVGIQPFEYAKKHFGIT